MTADFHELLTSRAHWAGVAVSSRLASNLEVYFRLLNTWNARMNLTALSTSPLTVETVDRLLIEPLVASTHVSAAARTMLDVGSGSGSPAVPMALALHPSACIMVESKTKKSVFLREAVRALGLPGEVITARVENVLSARPALQDSIDLITLRAVRLDRSLVRALESLLSPTGQLFVFGGDVAEDLLATQLCLSDSKALLPGASSRLHQYVRRST